VNWDQLWREFVRRRGLFAAGAAMIAAGLVALGQWAFFQWRSQTVGRALVHQEAQRIAGAPASSTAPAPARWWNAALGAPPATTGILEIPALGLSAPVAEGVSDAVLNVAVGHLPTSVEPGQIGTSVLSAHNATWFRNLNQLEPGAVIRYLTPERTYVFRVTGARTVHTGTPIYNSTDPTLILETCYPLNALYLTPYRYLVDADLAAVEPPERPGQLQSPQTVKLNLPQGLSLSALSLNANSAPEGTLSETGSPSPSFIQSDNPLAWANATTSLYFAVLRTATEKRLDWWEALAPGLSSSAVRPLWGGRVGTYWDPLDISLTVTGTHVRAATLTTAFSVLGTAGAGRYRVVMTARANGSTLALEKWKMTPEP
jgi:sortase A